MEACLGLAFWYNRSLNVWLWEESVHSCQCMSRLINDNTGWSPHLKKWTKKKKCNKKELQKSTLRCALFVMQQGFMPNEALIHGKLQRFQKFEFTDLCREGLNKDLETVYFSVSSSVCVTCVEIQFKWSHTAGSSIACPYIKTSLAKSIKMMVWFSMACIVKHLHDDTLNQMQLTMSTVAGKHFMAHIYICIIELWLVI